MKITLKASEVAAILGRNPYKPRKEVLDELWKKYSPDTFTGKTKRDRAEEALGASDEARKVLAGALAVKAKDSAEAARTFEEAKAAIRLAATVREAIGRAIQGLPPGRDANSV